MIIANSGTVVLLAFPESKNFETVWHRHSFRAQDLSGVCVQRANHPRQGGNESRD